MTTKEEREAIVRRIAETFTDPLDILEEAKKLGIKGKRAQTALAAVTGTRTRDTKTIPGRAAHIHQLIARENANGHYPSLSWLLENAEMWRSKTRAAIRLAKKNGSVVLGKNGYTAVDPV